MSSNSEIVESNKDLDLQARPPEAQDGEKQVISPEDKALPSTDSSKALATNKNSAVEIKIQATLNAANKTASAITGDSVPHVLADSNQSIKDSQLSTDILVTDNELSHESSTSGQVFEVKSLKKNDSAPLGPKENISNKDISVSEFTLTEDSQSDNKTTLCSETAMEIDADNAPCQDINSSTEMDVDMELPEDGKNEGVELITANQDANVEPATTNNNIDVAPGPADQDANVELCIPDSNVNVISPTAGKEANVELPTVVTGADGELPTTDKDEDIKSYLADKNANVETLTDNRVEDVELPIVNKHSDAESPIAHKDDDKLLAANVNDELHTVEMGADVELPTANEDEDAKLNITDKDVDIEQPAVDMDADIELPTVEMGEDLELPTANEDEGAKLHSSDNDEDIEPPTADMNADVELSTVEMGADKELHTANEDEDAKLPMSDKDVDIEQPTVDMDADVELPTVEMGADKEPHTAEEDAKLPISDKDVDIELPTVDMDADVEPSAETDAGAKDPTFEINENVHLSLTAAEKDVQFPKVNTSANVSKSGDNKVIECHTNVMDADVTLSSYKKNSNDNFHKNPMDSESELPANSNENVKNIPTEKFSVEPQPVKSTKGVEGPPADLKDNIQLPQPVNNTCSNLEDEMSVDNPTADLNVAVELTLSEQRSDAGPSSSTVSGETGAKRTLLGDAIPPEELKTDLVKEPSDEPKSKKRRLDAGVNNYPAGLYLDNTIVPILRMALITLDRLRPQDPMQFIIDFLLQNKEKYSVKHEPLSNA